MSEKQNFELLARYNQWMNARIMEAGASLDAKVLAEDCGAYFKSMLGTMNHILVADILWLKRFAEHAANFRSLDYVRKLDNPAMLSDILFSHWQELTNARDKMDKTIIEFTEEIDTDELDSALVYHNMKGERSRRKLSWLLLHLFNHQAHHRGQLTTLLLQHGIDVGVTDLPAILPDLDDDNQIDRLANNALP